MEEQPLNLRGTFKAVKSHRLLVGVLAVLGLCAALAYGIKTKPSPEARTLVLLPPSAITNNPGQSPYTVTQKIIVKSASVLSVAGSSVFPTVSAAELEKDLTVTSPSQDVLQIAVHAHTLGEAERLADAVAASYISYVAGTANGSEQLQSRLHEEATKLTGTIIRLQGQINAAQSRFNREKATSPAGTRDASLLNTLTTEQDQLSIQLSNINSQLVNAEVTTAQATSATQLLQRAEPVTASVTRLPLFGVLGLLAGLIAGFVLAVGLARSDHRLRTRDAIAAAIGLPVVASTWAQRCKSVGDWRHLLEQSRNPSAVEAWNVRRVFHRLLGFAAPPTVEVRLLAFSGDYTAVAAAVKMTGAAAALGAISQLEIGGGQGLAQLRAAVVVTPSETAGSAVVELKASSATSAELAGLTAITRLEAIDPDKPEVSGSFTSTLLLVSTGFATSAELAKTALAASDAGSPLVGVVITNPDPDDTSTGLLPVDPEETMWSMQYRLNGHASPELAGKEPN